MKSFSSRDMDFVTRPFEKADALACFKANGSEVQELKGTQFVTRTKGDSWLIELHGTLPDGSQGTVEHIDVFLCYPVRHGFTCGIRSEGYKDGYKITHQTRIELLSDDRFTKLVNVFLFNQRYDEYNIHCPQPLYLAPIPMELRVRPPYFMAGKDLFVAYPPTPFIAKKKKPPPAIEDCLIFATNAHSWVHTVTPQPTARQTLRALGL